eukprot:5713392-Amphidinium_carterae.2
MAVNTRYDPNKPTTIISPNKNCVVEVEDIRQQANTPKQLRQPPQPANKARTATTPNYTHAMQILAPNLCEGQRTISSPSTRRSQKTILDTVGLRVHKVQHSHKPEVPGAHSLDLCGDDNWTMLQFVHQGKDRPESPDTN